MHDIGSKFERVEFQASVEQVNALLRGGSDGARLQEDGVEVEGCQAHDVVDGGRVLWQSLVVHNVQCIL